MLVIRKMNTLIFIVLLISFIKIVYFTNLGKNAIEYLDKRHIDKDTIKKTVLGFSKRRNTY